MKRILAFVQVALLVGLASCGEAFLTKDPPAVASGSSLLNSTGVEGLLTGIYPTLRGGSIFGSSMATDWVYGSAAADDAYKGSEETDQNNFNDIERYGAQPSNAYLGERWRDCYNIVARANQAITFLRSAQESSIDLGKPKGTYKTGTAPADRGVEVEAEIKFLRAWAHFQAQKVFKNLPYIMTPAEMDGVLEVEVPNTGPIWADIERELLYAAQNLPDYFNGEPGRADKWAAKAVLAHAYMHQNKLTEAAPLLDEIINSGNSEKGAFTLVTNYWDNYNEDTENNTESIFEIQASTSAGGHTSLRLTGAVFPQAGGPSVGGWGFYQPSQVLVEAFQVRDDGLPYLNIADRPVFKHDMGVANSQDFVPSDQPIDPRLDWTVTRRGVDINGWGIATAQIVRTQANGGPYMTKKFLHMEKNRANQNGSGFNNERNFRMYRLTHILLWRAECYIESNELSKAIELVNMVRNRAKTSEVVMGVCSVTAFSAATVDKSLTDWTKPAGNYNVEPYPASHAVFSSQAEARKAVRLEIQIEFATEGHRFFDLRRWGMGTATPNYDVEVLNDFIARDVTFRGFMTGATYKLTNRWWPVPLAQLDLQRGVLTQYEY